MKKYLFVLLILAATCLNAFAQSLYDPNQITTIEITFPQSNWHELLNNFYATGNDERLIGTVEINGEPFDSVGIRYRGGDTYRPANAKNPLNIKLDFVKNQNYQGFDVLKLSNGAKDPSWLREVLTFEIARQYMEAPKANYASVYVNGNFLGVYANVESINSKFFSDRFLSDTDNPRFECNPSYAFDEPPTTAPTGCNLGHGAALEYLGMGATCYIDHYQIQSNLGWDELANLANLLQNTPQNARQVLDLDRFTWLSALNSLLVNLDSYLGASVRNYFIGKTDNGLFVPVPDDPNESFARFPWATIPSPGTPQPALGFYTGFDPFLGAGDDQKPLLKALFGNATWKRMYVAHLRTMIGEIFASGWFGQRATALQGLIGNEVQSDANHFYSYNQFLNNLDGTVIDPYDGEDAYGLMPLMQGRVSYLMGLPEFSATPPTIQNIAGSPATPTPGTNVTITATVGNASNNAVWLGYRHNLKEAFVLAQMFDDGNHGDGAAADGVFGASVTVSAEDLQYYLYAENSQAGIFSPQRAEFEFHRLGVSGSVVINELMPSNQATIADQDGEFDDWAELYNNSAATINLAGWYLTDDPGQLTKWQFPNGTFIDANSFLTVWVDGDDTQAGLHTPFKLSAGGENLLLVMPSLTIADQVTYPPQAPDISLARCPNGTGAFTNTAPTFGANNNATCTVATTDRTPEFAFKMYPNPASGWLILETEKDGPVKARVLDVFGRRHLEAGFFQKKELDINGLSPGIYFVTLEGGGVKKLVVQR